MVGDVLVYMTAHNTIAFIRSWDALQIHGDWASVDDQLEKAKPFPRNNRVTTRPQKRLNCRNKRITLIFLRISRAWDDAPKSRTDYKEDKLQSHSLAISVLGKIRVLPKLSRLPRPKWKPER